MKELKGILIRLLVVAIIVAVPFIIMILNIPYISFPFWWVFGQLIDGDGLLAILIRLVFIFFGLIAYCYIFQEEPKTPNIFFFWRLPF